MWKIVNMVRTGVLPREKGIEKIKSPEDTDMDIYFEKELGML
jgi:hypothetical protein